MVILIIIEYILQFFTYQFILLYNSFFNNVFILSVFLQFKYYYINTKLNLLKNIFINLFDLLVYINFTYIYFILFVNKK